LQAAPAKPAEKYRNRPASQARMQGKEIIHKLWNMEQWNIDKEGLIWYCP